MSKSLKDLSRLDWTADGPKPSLDQISLGAQLRMADSLERMEKPFRELIESNEYLRKRNKELSGQIEARDHTIRTLKGWITRLKRKTESNG